VRVLTLSEGLLAKTKHSVALIKKAREKHGNSLVYPASFGAESSVLIDIICRFDLCVPVVTLDTGKLPPETHALLSKIEKRYAIKINVITPEQDAVSSMISHHGEDLYRKSVELRQQFPLGI